MRKGMTGTVGLWCFVFLIWGCNERSDIGMDVHGCDSNIESCSNHEDRNPGNQNNDDQNPGNQNNGDQNPGNQNNGDQDSNVNGCDPDKEDCLSSDLVGKPCQYEDLRRTCLDGEVLMFCDNGRWTTFPCAGVCVLGTELMAYCTSLCSNPGEKLEYCNLEDNSESVGNAYSFECKDEGGRRFYEYKNYTFCANGCDADSISCKSCTNGETKIICIDDEQDGYSFSYEAYVECQNNDWDLITDGESYSVTMCPKGCDAEKNQCEKVIEEQGRPCNVNTFKDKCVDGYVVSCSKIGHVQVTSCDDGGTCQESSKLGFVGCASRCIAETPVHQYCVDNEYINAGLIVDTVCERLSDGKVWGFYLVKDFCEGYCNTAGTACQ